MREKNVHYLKFGGTREEKANGPVTTRKMTEEERRRYGPPNPRPAKKHRPIVLPSKTKRPGGDAS